MADGNADAVRRAQEDAKANKSSTPTRKWIAARVTAAAGIIILYITSDNWNDEEWIATVTLVSEAIVSYLVPNDSTPSGDGVPAKS